MLSLLLYLTGRIIMQKVRFLFENCFKNTKFQTFLHSTRPLSVIKSYIVWQLILPKFCIFSYTKYHIKYQVSYGAKIEYQRVQKLPIIAKILLATCI